ncbi:MAG: diguanylate cyclase, partial [Spirochaetales bacterium]|nr:diguanylate cyclase [Spirochaetales bacterium]
MLNREEKPDKAATEALRKDLAVCEDEKNQLENQILILNESIASHEEKERDLLKRLYLNEKTGLPNHTYLYRDGTHVFSAKNNDAADNNAALLFIALDETYEVIKKTQASAVSEWILYKTALWIREIIGDSGKVYQTGSTEFAVILRKVGGPEHCAALAERIYHKLLETHRFPGTQLTIGCSIGCAIFPIDGSEKALIF